MSDLSDDARTLLARAKQERRASPAALARVRSNVLRRAGVSAAVGAVGTALAAKTAAAPAAPAAWLLAAKTLGGVLLFGAVAAGGIALGRRNEDLPLSAAHTPVPAPPASLAVAAVASSAAPPVDPIEVPATSTLARPVASARPRSAAPPPPAASPTAAVWAADLALLRDAQSSMVAGDPERARALAERVAKGGTFGRERDALIAIADCKVAARDDDRRAAQERAATFVSTHDGSALAARVSAACRDGSSSLP